VAIGLYTRWLDARAMFVGRAAGMAWGTYMAIDLDFKGSVYKVFGINAYEALWGLALNLVVAVALTAVLRAIGAGDSADETVLDDYEERDPGTGTRPLAATPEQDRLAGPAGA
jgi:solute:Na+ symporter, SSS family